MNCFVSVAGLCYGQMPALMALLFSVCPRNADLVLNSPCLGGFQCHFSHQLVIITGQQGQVWRLFLPPFKGALMEARLTRQKKKKREGLSTYSLLIKVSIPQRMVKSVYLCVFLVVVIDKLGRRHPDRRTW